MANYVPINVKPGVDSERPSLTSETTWRSCNKVRFKNGQPEKIGGWSQATTTLAPLTGIARSIHTWRLNNGTIIVAIGTHQKLHLMADSEITDITPLRVTGADPGTDKLAATNTSTTITVDHTGHGSSTGDYVTVAGAVMAATSIVDAEVNANHQITVVDGNTYTFEVTTAATSTDANDGGASVTIDYEVSVGPATAVVNYGYGAGPYGEEEYGDIRTISGIALSPRLWSFDNFGEDLVACYESGRIYQWTYASNYTDRAALVANSPTYSDFIVVTSPDRHLVAFSTDGTTGTQNRLMLAWADQETTTTWTPTAENTAGDLLISTGSKLVAARKTERATLLWTDSGMHSMQFIGSPFTFSIVEVGTHCGAISQACVVSKDTSIYWMGKDNFFIYNGTVSIIPCTLHRAVFKNIKKAQLEKVVGGVIEEFNEIIWFYPSDSGEENDSYVIYNHVENLWYNGTLVRTAWQDSELNTYPLGINDTGTIFNHEVTVDDNGSAITAYIESSDFDIENGDTAYLISELVPDMTIGAGSVDYIFKTKRYPHSTLTTDTTSTVSSSTENVDIRVRTKIMSIRIESDALSDDWRMGVPRIAIRPDGGRA